MSRKAIAENRVVDYDEFLEQPEVLSLKAEIAFLRTLLVEYRESMQTRRIQKVKEFVDGSVQEISRDWDCEDWELEKLKRILMQNTVEVFGVSSVLSATDAQTMLKIAEAIGKTVERGKSLEEGISIKIDWGEVPGKLQAFLQKIVFQLIPSEKRALIAHRAKTFFGANPMDQLDVGGLQVHPNAKVVA